MCGPASSYIRSHAVFAQSLVCECPLCSDWRRWVDLCHRAEAATKDHPQKCSCKLCGMLTRGRHSALAAELRLNTWIELSWYAELEGWDEGWAERAIKLISQPDKWWMLTGQYRPIGVWLDEFEDFGAKEKILHDFKR